MRLDWAALLGAGRWSMVSNLPYNVSVPLVLEPLETAPAIDRYVVMVQREVGERLVAGPGAEGYGAVSVRVAYHADARVVRRVPADVFWPRPKIDSVLVRLEPRGPGGRRRPGGAVRGRERRVRGAAQDDGERPSAARSGRRERHRGLRSAGLDPGARAEQLGLDGFARITETMLERGWTP